MSRILIRTWGAFSQGANIRRTLVLRKSLGTDASVNSGTTGPSRSPSLLVNTIIESRDTQRIITEDSRILNRVFHKELGMLLSDRKSDPAGLEDSKNFAAKDVVDKRNQASLEQLTRIADAMTYHLPRFFTTPHPFQLYTKDLVFIDNIRQVRVQGLAQYATRIALVKLYHRLRYTSTKCEVLNLVKHPEESCIRIRWRIVSRPGLLQFVIFFYKFHSTEIWNDGVSTLLVNNEGKIYCHVCDNIDVDESKTEVKKTIKALAGSSDLV